MNMTKRNLLAAGLLIGFPLAGLAQDIGYTYIEGGYSRIDSGIDADGWAANGSFALTENVHLFGGYAQNEFSNSNVDLGIFNTGLGYNLALSDRLHLLGRGGYENLDTSFTRDLDLWFGEGGVRGAPAANLEAWALAGYEDGDRVDGELYGKLGGLIKLNPTWGLSAEVKLIDDDQQYFIGPRINF